MGFRATLNFRIIKVALNPEKFASTINYNEFNVGKQSKIYSMKISVDKQSQNTQV